MKSSVDLIIATMQILLFLCVPAGLFLAMAVMRHRERQRVLEVIRAAVEAGRPLPAELTEALLTGEPTPSRPDFRRGVVLIATGAGIAVIGFCAQFAVTATGGSGSVAVGVSIASLGVIPAFIGVALILLSRGERA